MRISDQVRYDSIRSSVGLATERLSSIQQQLATGERINKPSDDPTATAELLRLSAQQADADEGGRLADTANARLSATDSTLGQVTDIVQRARELAVQARSGSLSASDRQAIGTEVNQLLLQAVQDGNAQLGGQYIFAGAKTTAAPFATSGAAPASVTYNGDDTAVVVPLQGSQQVRVDVPGDQALGSTFEALIKLRDAVNANDGTATDSATSALDGALDTLNQTRATVGARINMTDALHTAANTDSTAVQARRSSLSDLDIADAVVRLNQAQNSYQASLSTAARLMQTNLLDFLQPPTA